MVEVKGHTINKGQYDTNRCTHNIFKLISNDTQVHYASALFGRSKDVQELNQVCLTNNIS